MCAPGLLNLSQTLDTQLHRLTWRGELEAVADEIDDDLKDSVLITPKTHILDFAQSERLPHPLGSVVVRCTEQYPEVDVALACLFLKDIDDLGANIDELEFLLFQTQLLADLVLAKGQEIRKQMQQKISRLVDDSK